MTIIIWWGTTPESAETCPRSDATLCTFSAACTEEWCSLSRQSICHAAKETARERVRERPTGNIQKPLQAGARKNRDDVMRSRCSPRPFCVNHLIMHENAGGGCAQGASLCLHRGKKTPQTFLFGATIIFCFGCFRDSSPSMISNISMVWLSEPSRRINMDGVFPNSVAGPKWQIQWIRETRVLPRTQMIARLRIQAISYAASKCRPK